MTSALAAVVAPPTATRPTLDDVLTYPEAGGWYDCAEHGWVPPDHEHEPVAMTTETLVPETVSPILPSEALKLGRLLRPRHTRGTAFAGLDGACALGAMYVGWGGDVGRVRVDADGFAGRLIDYGLGRGDIAGIFDAAELAGEDGDAAVLAFLEERGL